MLAARTVTVASGAREDARTQRKLKYLFENLGDFAPSRQR
jgi:hypothetical protein